MTLDLLGLPKILTKDLKLLFPLDFFFLSSKSLLHAFINPSICTYLHGHKNPMSLSSTRGSEDFNLEVFTSGLIGLLLYL